MRCRSLIAADAVNFHNYDPEGFYDELFASSGTPRSGAALLVQRIDGLTDGELRRRQEAAELALLNMGITFNVYGEETGTERIFPFDTSPASCRPPNGVTSRRD